MNYGQGLAETFTAISLKFTFTVDFGNVMPFVFNLTLRLSLPISTSKVARGENTIGVT